MKQISDLNIARKYIADGLVIAYPTEAVYGLGCDPFNEQAVMKILDVKGRSVDKGLILLISEWSQLTPLVGEVADHLMEKVKSSWPGPITWIFPKSSIIPKWISGNNSSVAIRMTAHPLARKLCSDGPLVSTSANIQGQDPVSNLENLKIQFSHCIDGIVLGDLGSSLQPSAIYNVANGERLR
ncbi:MAG: L-threonylcarbamoyladenylate synthase [Legionellaceae bacterium]|nr:L-threonylcarbamoyladenylate synthase [Legionellaceae bacterium]